MSFIPNTQIPALPPNPTQDLFSKGVQKVRELINHQRSMPPPSEEEMKRRQKAMIREIDGVSASGASGEVPSEFDTRIDVHDETSVTQNGFLEQHEFGEPSTNVSTVNTGKSYETPADRIDRDISIIDTVSGKSVKLPFVPRELKYTPEANWKAIASMGRNNPLYHFTGGEDTLEFEIDWFAQKENRTDVLLNCKWLESLSKNDAYENPPPPVILHWNKDMFSDSLWIVHAAPYRMLDFQAHKNMLPQQAYQQVTLKRITETNLTRAQIQSLTI